MLDKRPYYSKLNQLKDEFPDSTALLEAVQAKLDAIEPVTAEEARAMIMHPAQYIKKMPLPNGGWTTQLHIWADNGIGAVLRVPPLYLSATDSRGSTVLECLTDALLGKYTEIVNYVQLKKLLEGNWDYEEVQPDKSVAVMNLLDHKDYNNETIIDRLINYAYSKGVYSGCEEDAMMQELLTEYANKVSPETTSGDVMDDE